jgi:hypothetical protein
MINRRPLFVADDHVSHMKRVFEVIGTPKSTQELSLATNPDASSFIKSLRPVRRCTFATKVGGRANASLACCDALIDVCCRTRFANFRCNSKCHTRFLLLN